jgi:ADP-ribose pyrophosphatase
MRIGMKISKSSRIQARKEILSARSFKILNISYDLPNGKKIERTVVDHIGAVVILPIREDGRILMVRQYRWSIEESLLELPAGTREVGEDPLPTAQRELAEEVGCQASSWEFLGELFPAPGFCSEKQFCYLARGLSEKTAEGDEDEEIEIVPMTREEIEAAIASNEIKDAKTIAVLGLARAKGVWGSEGR